jgi:hypothetical protein
VAARRLTRSGRDTARVSAAAVMRREVRDRLDLAAFAALELWLGDPALTP